MTSHLATMAGRYVYIPTLVEKLVGWDNVWGDYILTVSEAFLTISHSSFYCSVYVCAIRVCMTSSVNI